MTKRSSTRDLSDRALAVIVRLLPSQRSEWGRAMRAELSSLDDLRVRRRFTLGCVRAVLSDRVALRAVALHVVALTFGAVALALASSINRSDVRIQTFVFISALGALAWSGRRSGPLGPVAENPSARRIRAAGYVVLGSYILPALASFAGASAQYDQSGVWTFYVAVTIYLATVLLVTAQRTAARPRVLQLIAAVTFAGVAAWWIPMLLEPSVRAHPAWALLSVAGSITLGLIVATALRWPSEQARSAVMGTGVAVCLLIFLAAAATYAVDPSLAPDLGQVPGLTASGEADQNRAEAVDPYVLELFLGALLGAVLIAATTASRSVRLTEGHHPAS